MSSFWFEINLISPFPLLDNSLTGCSVSASDIPFYLISTNIVIMRILYRNKYIKGYTVDISIIIICLQRTKILCGNSKFQHSGVSARRGQSTKQIINSNKSINITTVLQKARNAGIWRPGMLEYGVPASWDICRQFSHICW